MTRLVLLFLFTFCKFPEWPPDPTLQTTSRTSQTAIPIVQTNIFPNNIGDHWTYRFRGFSLKTGSTDSITVEIIGQIPLPDGTQANIWVYHYPDAVDTNYVVSGDKTIKIYNKYYNYCNPCNGIMPLEKFRYNIPLDTGRSWLTNGPYGDTIKVIAISSLTVSAAVFPNTFLIINQPGKSRFTGNFRRKDSIWFTPYIGVTKRKQQDYELKPAPGNGVWELSDYTLK